MLPSDQMILVIWSRKTSPMNRVWKIGVNSHATRLIGLAPGVAGSSGAWLGVGVTPGEPPLARAAERRARGDDQRQRNEQQDRRQADEGRLEAGHAVLSRLGQRTGS